MPTSTGDGGEGDDHRRGRREREWGWDSLVGGHSLAKRRRNPNKPVENKIEHGVKKLVKLVVRREFRPKTMIDVENYLHSNHDIGTSADNNQVQELNESMEDTDEQIKTSDTLVSATNVIPSPSDALNGSPSLVGVSNGFRKI
ncbi:hypothetical protein TIFTF001_045653 [Ficus carica]|uniref:Uncharacterized protein n=1 Tax=Ficus carica TaxID=3494 RepID=A0AA87Z6M2_FICCA|nr:hypothetical protein TIFTF001_045653 [Ficus carica]